MENSQENNSKTAQYHGQSSWNLPCNELISSWMFRPYQDVSANQGPGGIPAQSTSSHSDFTNLSLRNDYDYSMILKSEYPTIDRSELSIRNQMLHIAQFLYVAPSKIAGLGVYSRIKIRANQPIIQYVGELMRERIADLRESRYDQEGHYGTYIFRIEGEQVIDATTIGGMARFINHSCDPNCISKRISLGDKISIVIFSKKEINIGEELSYDYKLPYEDISKRIPCNCGASNCRGWMNWSEYHQSRIDNPRSFTSPDYLSSDSDVDPLNESSDQSDSSDSDNFSVSKYR